MPLWAVAAAQSKKKAVPHAANWKSCPVERFSVASSMIHSTVSPFRLADGPGSSNPIGPGDVLVVRFIGHTTAWLREEDGKYTVKSTVSPGVTANLSIFVQPFGIHSYQAQASCLITPLLTVTSVNGASLDQISWIVSAVDPNPLSALYTS